MQRFLTITVLLVALVALWRYWPSDERRIQQLVQTMADALEPAAAETDLSRVARLAPLARGLAPDVVVDGAISAQGRDQVMAAALQVGRIAPGLSVVVRDIDVTVEPSRVAAAAIVTVAVSGAPDTTTSDWGDVTELELTLSRHDDVWLVTRVAPVVVLRR